MEKKNATVAEEKDFSSESKSEEPTKSYASNVSQRQTEKVSLAEFSMIRLLVQDLANLLIAMSKQGYLWLGRYGCGFTKKQLRAQMREGTYKVMDDWLVEADAKMVGEWIAEEGGIFCNYMTLVLKWNKEKKI